MTVLLIFMIVLAAVALFMLLFKLILELWAICGHLSKRFERIRSDYWRILSTTIVRIILIVYGIWALYCLWQFHVGDSWAASLLAAVTLIIFTAIIAFFTIRIFYLAQKAKTLEGGVDELYEHEPWMKKYGFFYDQFKSNFWWFFVPILLMSLIRAFFIVFAGTNGLVQAVGILAAEGVFLVLLFWRRPYDGRGANVVNAMVAVVRVLSIACILIFVDQLGSPLLSDGTNGRHLTDYTDNYWGRVDCITIDIDRCPRIAYRYQCNRIMSSQTQTDAKVRICRRRFTTTRSSLRRTRRRTRTLPKSRRIYAGFNVRSTVSIGL